MKTLRFVLSALTVLLLSSGTFAQTKVKADIPFDFVVGNRYYPAGEYLLKTINDAGVIQITNEDLDTTIHMGSIPCSATEPSSKSVLQFSRMGNMYFLHRVWVAGQTTGREFPRSREERRLAQLHEKSEGVVVAANIVK